MGLEFFAPEEDVVVVLFVFEEEPQLGPVALWVKMETKPVVELVVATEPEAIADVLEVVLGLALEWDNVSFILPSFASLSCLRVMVFFWLILVSSP